MGGLSLPYSRNIYLFTKLSYNVKPINGNFVGKEPLKKNKMYQPTGMVRTGSQIFGVNGTENRMDITGDFTTTTMGRINDFGKRD